MKTLDIDQLYDAQFAAVPDGEEYSNFKGFAFLKNIFPAHTILGGLMGSENHSKGIELGNLFGGGKKHHHKKPKPQPVIVQAPPKPEKKDHTKMYMIGGGVLLLVIILMFVFMHKK